MKVLVLDGYRSGGVLCLNAAVNEKFKDAMRTRRLTEVVLPPALSSASFFPRVMDLPFIRHRLFPYPVIPRTS